MNHAILMKTGWRLISNGENFWSSIIRNKYEDKSGSVLDFFNPSMASSTWKGIFSGIDLLKQKIIRRVIAALKLIFGRTDGWNLVLLSTSDLTMHLTRLFLIFLTLMNGSQANFKTIFQIMSSKKLWWFVLITLALLSTNGCGVSLMMKFFLLNLDTNFSLKRTVLIVGTGSSFGTFKSLLESVVFFGLSHGKLLTNSRRTTRHFTNDPSCSRCNFYK